jgi:hypothetical protein
VSLKYSEISEAISLQPLHLIDEISHRVVSEYTEAICALARTCGQCSAETRDAATTFKKPCHDRLQGRGRQTRTTPGAAALAKPVLRTNDITFGKRRCRFHCGNSSTGFIAAPEVASAAAQLTSAKS